MEGQVDCLISGVGTGGTITGVSEAIKQRNPSMKSIAVEPEESPVISQTRNGQEGKPGPHKIQGGAGFVPKNLNLDIVDDVELVSSDDAFEMARKLSLEEGILGGISTGATVTAAPRVAAKPEMEGKRIVVIGASCEALPVYSTTAGPRQKSWMQSLKRITFSFFPLQPEKEFEVAH